MYLIYLIIFPVADCVPAVNRFAATWTLQVKWLFSFLITVMMWLFNRGRSLSVHLLVKSSGRPCCSLMAAD